jgi:predicted alpha/beta hydrolase family esterase
MQFLIVPGIDGSGPEHWQSRWEDEWGSSASRIAPSSWTQPDLADWCHALDRAAADQRAAGVVLVAHSLGCLAAGRWLSRAQPGVRGAFLVAPPDPAGPNFPAAAAPSFTTFEAAPLTVPGLVVGSDDDPYCTPLATRRLAEAWGTGLEGVGAAGHINTASGIGAWAAGQALLTAFIAGL